MTERKIDLITATGKMVFEIMVSPLAVLPMVILHEGEGYMRVGANTYQRCVTWISDGKTDRNYRHYSKD
jgi:hypothetical protein